MFRKLRQRLARLLADALLGNRDFYDAAMGVLHRRGVMAFAAVDRFGHPVLLHPRDRTITRTILRDGAWQHDVFENFESFVRTRTAGQVCFVDVGANVGSHSVYALHSPVFDVVVAIEANPELAMILKCNLTLNGAGKQYAVFNLGAHSECGSLRFSHNHRNIGGGSFRHAVAAESETILDVSPLSEILDVAGVAQSGSSLAFWVDVEGHEVEVLKGAERMFQNHKIYLCIEVTPGRLSEEEAAYLVALFDRAISVHDAATLAETTIGNVLHAGKQADVIACFDAS